MHIYRYMRRTYTLDSISDICIAVRSCLLLPSDDVYSTTNPNCKFPLMYLICMYIYFKDPPQLKSQCDLSWQTELEDELNALPNTLTTQYTTYTK